MPALPRETTVETMTTAQRQAGWRHVLASGALEGFVPDRALADDVQANIAGALSTQQMLERAIERAKRDAEHVR